MVARTGRSLAREIVALALAAAVFVAAVAAARLEGVRVGGGPVAADVLCLSGDAGPDAPGQKTGAHQHCTLCAFAASGCAETATAQPLRIALSASAGAQPSPSRLAALIHAFDARGPPTSV